MSRRVSLLILAGSVVAIGVLFYQVVQPFLFSLLFAAVLAVLFGPAYRLVVRLCRGYRRIAAGLTTAAIIVVILLPIGGVLVLAGGQLVDMGKDVVTWVESPEDSQLAKQFEKLKDTAVADWLVQRYRSLTDQQQQRLKQLVSRAADTGTQEIYGKTQALVANVVSFVVGLVVMGLALYYFFADGPGLLGAMKELSPLEDADEDALLEQFEKVCRGVVMGTVVSAVAQGVLAGIGFAIVGVEWLWLAAALTMLSSFIPFLGAAAVWLVVGVTLILDGRYGSATFVVVYGAIVVSGSDNLIKAYLIGGESKLHPLVVLITVLGALRLVGLWGIFVGPMIAAFFYALLKILRKRLMANEPSAMNGSIAD